MGELTLCTWYSHTEQDAVVDDRDEAQDTFGPLQLLGFRAQLLVAGRRHIGPVDHDHGASPGRQRPSCDSGRVFASHIQTKQKGNEAVR